VGVRPAPSLRPARQALAASVRPLACGASRRPEAAALGLTLTRDPYQVLGVGRDVSDEDLRSAYRRLAQLHHPDHNGGSVEAARRFEEIQDAYAEIVSRRQKAPRTTQATSRVNVDPAVEARLADLERDIRQVANAARERAQRAAREAKTSRERPSDEELGYVHTDDTIGKILADARDEFSRRIGDAREEPVSHRAADLLEDLASWLKHDPDSDDGADTSAPKRP
jgi:hypothetical protein